MWKHMVSIEVFAGLYVLSPERDAAKLGS